MEKEKDLPVFNTTNLAKAKPIENQKGIIFLQTVFDTRSLMKYRTDINNITTVFKKDITGVENSTSDDLNITISKNDTNNKTDISGYVTTSKRLYKKGELVL